MDFAHFNKYTKIWIFLWLRMYQLIKAPYVYTLVPLPIKTLSGRFIFQSAAYKKTKLNQIH